MSPDFAGRTELAIDYFKEAKLRLEEAKVAYSSAVKKVQDGKQVAVEIELEREHSLFAIILSVFALEAHINKMGHDYLKKKDCTCDKK